QALEWLEQLASHRRGAVVLFALGLAVYAVRAIGWPLIGGRDLDEYLYDYVQFLDWHPLLPWSMLFRTPVPGIVDGAPLDVARGLGGRAARGGNRAARGVGGLERRALRRLHTRARRQRRDPVLSRVHHRQDRVARQRACVPPPGARGATASAHARPVQVVRRH